MKALTLAQPYASLVTSGRKHFETRSWRTNYRGPLAIHASARMPAWAKEKLASDPVIAAALKGTVWGTTLPCGLVLATATLVACHSTEDALAQGLIGAEEEAMGFYGPGRYAWQLADVRPLAHPMPAKGALGLWSWM